MNHEVMIRLLEELYETCKQIEGSQKDSFLEFDAGQICERLSVGKEVFLELAEKYDGLIRLCNGKDYVVSIPRLHDVLHVVKNIQRKHYSEYQGLSKEGRRRLEEYKYSFLKYRNMQGKIEWESVNRGDREFVAAIELARIANNTAQQAISTTKATWWLVIGTWLLVIADVILSFVN